MSKMTLYDISMEGMQLESILTENDGELTPELEARMDALLLEGPQRIEAAAMVVRTLETSAEAAKAEAKRLTERAASFESNAKSLKQRITIALDAAFNGKVKTPLFTIWNQTSPDTVSFELDAGEDIHQIAVLHPDLVRTTYALDKKAIAEVYKDNKPLPDAIIPMPSQGIRYVRIK
jgi:hypothetical protein